MSRPVRHDVTRNPLQKPSESEAPPRRFRGRANLVACALALALTLFSASLPWGGTGPLSSRGAINAEWYLYLLAIQLVTMPAIVWICGRPAGVWGMATFALINLELLAVAGLVKTFALQSILVHGLHVGVRLGLAALWSFCVLGLPFVAVRILARNRSRPRPGFPLGKWWFAAVVVLLIAEPAAALIERFERSANLVALPESLAPPDEGELRVAAVGESTMAGFPYNGRYGIAEVLALQLERMYPNRKIVVENLARDGLNLRKALLTLAALERRPHLLVLYSGHNEFFYDLEELWNDVELPWQRADAWLNWSPAFRLFDRRLSRMGVQRELEGEIGRKLADRNIATPKAHQLRLDRFRAQLEQLGEWCRRRKIACVWFVPAGSEADFEPNRSCLNHDPTPAEREELERIAAAGRELQRAERWDEAAAVYREALERFNEFAEFHFQLAECLARTERYSEAQRHYAQALELDGHPIRMTEPYRRQIVEAALTFDIPRVDVAGVLRPHTPHGILDRTAFVDYVHPNLRAYHRLGVAAAEAVGSSALLHDQIGKPAEAAPIDFWESLNALRLTAADLAQAYLRVAQADETQQKLRYESSRLERESRQYREWSRRLRLGEISPGEGGTEPLTPRPDE